MSNSSSILSNDQITLLRSHFQDRVISVSYGAGVDSTCVLVILHEAGIKPGLISFADVGGEKTSTMLHVDRMNNILKSWDWPLIEVCRKVPLPTTPYTDLYGNCLSNFTLPSLSYGKKGCSVKWKAIPQTQLIKGIKSGPNKRDPHPIWSLAQARSVKILKVIGYDNGISDIRRSKKPRSEDIDFDYIYPLQIIGWARPDCVRAIANAIGADMVPIKSACFFCPASKAWELFWLAATEPELLEKALVMEWVAMTGRNSRFTIEEFGSSWEEMVITQDTFPKTNTCVGLGRSFSWNQWARVNKVVDNGFRVLRSDDDKQRFLAMVDSLQGNDNALDCRTEIRKIFPIIKVCN